MMPSLRSSFLFTPFTLSEIRICVSDFLACPLPFTFSFVFVSSTKVLMEEKSFFPYNANSLFSGVASVPCRYLVHPGYFTNFSSMHALLVGVRGRLYLALFTLCLRHSFTYFLQTWYESRYCEGVFWDYRLVNFDK